MKTFKLKLEVFEKGKLDLIITADELTKEQVCAVLDIILPKVLNRSDYV